MRRIIENWRMHGLPRCTAYFFEDDGFCHRLIWPWQEAVGPVDLVHASCKRLEEAAAARWEADHPWPT